MGAYSATASEIGVRDVYVNDSGRLQKGTYSRGGQAGVGTRVALRC
jgi:hypothetical protein